MFDSHLKDRLVIIDPSDPHPPALNFFKLQSDDLIFYLFKAIDQSFTPRQATMISFLMELMRNIDGATLMTLIEVCESRENRYPDVVKDLSAFARSFFENQFYARKPDQLVAQTKSQIANRIYTLGRLSKFQQMFSARENAFDPYECMQEKKVVLINTDARPARLGGLGEASSILGRFILAQCLDAARSRPKDKRHLALLVVDEAKTYMDQQAALILSDARQFGLGLLLATQFPHQLEEGVRKEINTNTTIKMMGPVEYSTSSALGFAAQNREGTAVARQVSHDAYEDTRRELFDLEARRKDASRKEKPRLDTKIDDARRRLAAVRNKNPAPADAQSQFLSALTHGFVEARHVRVALVALFALMVEMCATLGLFAALSHSFEKLPPTTAPAEPRGEARVPTRWTPKAS